MVPYRLVRIITSNCQGLDTSCMQQLSMIMSLVFCRIITMSMSSCLVDTPGC